MVKKSHTLKLLCIANLNKKILFLSEAYHGSCHDYTILKSELDPQQGKWFSYWDVLVDITVLQSSMKKKKTLKKQLNTTIKQYSIALKIKSGHQNIREKG